MTKKIIVEIAEGLGNQLFMYANAYSLSRKLNYDLMIDNTSGFSKKKNQLRKHQRYMLDLFCIDQKLAPNNLRYDDLNKRFIKKIELFIDKFRIKKKFIIEKNIKIEGKKKAEDYKDIDKFKLSDLVYVQGNYENHKYFGSFKNDLVRLFKPKKKFINYQNPIISELQETNSVSIHIRRHKYSEQRHEIKDGKKIQKSSDFTKNLIIYIKKSISFFEDKIDKPFFFIWSNDFVGLENEFDTKNLKFVKNNDVINDFYLFSLAKHFIVGGSSYHWWGAWLNESPNKICIRPSNLNPSNNEKFYPENWIKI